jgi:hypothetical protein
MSDRAAALLQAHKAICSDAAGLVDVVLVDPVIELRWADDAVAVTMITEWVARIGRDKPVCLLCDHAWQSLADPPPALFAIAKARCDEPHAAIASGICRDCAGKFPDADELLAATFARFRGLLWPGLREVEGAIAGSATLQ